MTPQSQIEQAFQNPELLQNPEYSQVIQNVITQLDNGSLRVCEKISEKWVTREWIKMAILLYFRMQKTEVTLSGAFSYCDKIPVKKWTGTEGVRVVPHALVRTGAFVASGCVLMPSYINIGAYVDSGTMVDTWATVGSCAHVGKNVHLSGGVGLGGVLEPVQATPVIIEDHAFIGSRAIIVEGAIVEEGAVVGAGVVITASTKILDVSGSRTIEHIGRVPRNSVVIPGSRTKTFPAGEFSVPCALIIGKRGESTDKKTSLNSALREFEVSF